MNIKEGSVHTLPLIPWEMLTDGQVHIGFREPDQLAGRDDNGNVTVSDETVLCGKVRLRDMGVQILHEFRLSPSITAEIPADPDFIAELRNFALIDYLEPVTTGEYYTTPLFY
ncbi:hypothetical protein DYD21_00605 [Rhodohalobacter sp. SW132]|uniref:hypothetical protein n=1 Tax=Rhodohalobacter sp. SW132 TaxID=2293433 RepID=UPI000E376A10|nr:hypothetical protein [Rhodohalobacter sp. SW132]REL38483.1 hypothetical protein DYD21_00605 [Rhodohalobacter sp. SW132]